MLLLSRADDRRLALEQTGFDLVRLVRELMEDAEILAEPAGLSLKCELPDEMIVFGDRRLLARAVMNLLDNAIKHNKADGRVTVTAAIRRRTRPSCELATLAPVFPAEAAKRFSSASIAETFRTAMKPRGTDSA